MISLDNRDVLKKKIFSLRCCWYACFAKGASKGMVLTILLMPFGSSYGSSRLRSSRVSRPWAAAVAWRRTFRGPDFSDEYDKGSSSWSLLTIGIQSASSSRRVLCTAPVSCIALALHRKLS